MKKTLTIVSALLVLATPLYAGSSGLSHSVTKFTVAGKGDNNLQVKLIDALDDILDSMDGFMASSTTIDSTKLSGDAITASSYKDSSVPTAKTDVETSDTVTLAGYVNWLNSTGAADAATNTITLANGAAGDVFLIFNDTSASNALAIAKTGNFHSPAIELAAGEGAVIVYLGTNVIYGIEK